MSWRIILITQACKLSTKNNQLIYLNEETQEELKVPLEDIASIILDTKQVHISGYLMSELAENGITVLTTNNSHIPNGVFMPYMQYYKNFETSILQSEWTEPFKKRLWQKIIQQKIKNHAYVIKPYNYEVYKHLIELSKKVLSGDEKNIEGVAAKRYFEVFYQDFVRGKPSKVNSALDYGYSIVRSLLAKNISAMGFMPCFGVHHCNKFNAFNLIDDMIEPFRAFVDYKVKNLFPVDSDNTDLTKEERQELISNMFYEVEYDGKKYSILYITQLVAENLLLITKEKDTKHLILPSFSDNLF